MNGLFINTHVMIVNQTFIKKFTQLSQTVILLQLIKYISYIYKVNTNALHIISYQSVITGSAILANTVPCFSPRPRRGC